MHRTQYAHEISDTLWLMILQGLNYLAPLLVWPYLMQILGAEQFGCISFAMAVNQYLMILVDFGFNFSVTKKIALAHNNQSEINKIFAETLGAKSILCGVSLLLLIALSLVPKFAIYRIELYLLFSMVVGSVFTYVWLFQGLGKIRIISIINCVAKLSILPLTFFFVKSKDDVLIATIIISSTYILTAILSIILTKRMHLAQITRTTWTNMKSTMKDSLPIFISTAATSVYTALFVVILAYFSTPDEVGRYTAAEKFMRVSCYMIWVPLSQAFFPKISQRGQSNPQEAQALTRKLYLVLCVSMLVVMFVLFFFTEPLAALLGKSYAGMGTIAKIMAPVPLLVSLGGAAAQLKLLAQGGNEEKRKYRNIYLIAALIAIISIVILAPTLGATGAAIAVLIVEAWVFVGMNYYYKKSKTRL